MTTKASIEQALEQRLLSPHTNITSGQFRWGGVVTSNCARRSRFLGRVAVTHVQGPPKGGGALGALKVTTTRLRPVPPESMEEPVQNKAKPVISALVIAALSAGLWAAPSYAQSSYDDILNGSRQDSMNRKRADQEAGSGSPAPTPVDPAAPWMTVESVGSGSTFNACIYNHRYKMGESEALASRNCLYNQTIPNDREVASIDPAAAQRERRRLAAQQASAQAGNDEWQRRQAYANSPAGRAAAKKRDEQAQAAAQAKAANEARRARACEDAGGTWGRRTNRYGTPVGEVGCFFQTVGN